MGFQAKVFKVFIASPSDVEEERKIIREVLDKWNSLHSQREQKVLLPIGWDTHSYPETGASPQDILNKQILKDADLLVGVFWTRLGTPTDSYPSGSVEEIEEHVKLGKPAMLYFSKKSVPQDANPEQFQLLKDFKESIQKRSLYRVYNDLESFHFALLDDITRMVNENSYFLNSTETYATLSVISKDSKNNIGISSPKSVDFDVQFYNKKTTEFMGQAISIDHKFIQKPYNIPNYSEPEPYNPFGLQLSGFSDKIVNKKYYRELVDFLYRELSFFSICLAIKNTGNANAEKIRIEIVIDKKDIRGILEKYQLPTKNDFPKKTISRLEMVCYNDFIIPRAGEGDLTINEDSNSFKIEVEYNQIQIGRTIILEPFFVSKNESGKITINGTIYSQLEPKDFTLYADCNIESIDLTMEKIYEMEDQNSE